MGEYQPVVFQPGSKGCPICDMCDRDYGGKESTPETVIKAIKPKVVKRSKDGVFSLKNSLTCTDLRFASGGERMVPDRRFAARFPMLFSMTRPLPISTMPTKNLALA